MKINPNQQVCLAALVGTLFGSSNRQALRKVELLDKEAISQIDPQRELKDLSTGSQDLDTYQKLMIIGQCFEGNNNGLSTLKVGRIIVEILQEKLIKPEEIEEQLKTFFQYSPSVANEVVQVFRNCLKRAQENSLQTNS